MSRRLVARGYQVEAGIKEMREDDARKCGLCLLSSIDGKDAGCLGRYPSPLTASNPVSPGDRQRRQHDSSQVPAQSLIGLLGVIFFQGSAKQNFLPSPSSTHNLHFYLPLLQLTPLLINSKQFTVLSAAQALFLLVNLFKLSTFLCSPSRATFHRAPSIVAARAGLAVSLTCYFHPIGARCEFHCPPNTCLPRRAFVFHPARHYKTWTNARWSVAFPS